MNYSIDYFGKNTESLKHHKLFLFDMDGTIYNEDQLFEGAIDLINHIKAIDGIYVFITNNSSKSVKDYINKVNNLGIAAGRDNFFTSTDAAISLMREKHPNALIYCQGTRSFIDELIGAGLNVTVNVSEDAEVVLVGFDTELTSNKIRNTCEMLQRDIPYYATNPDLACPVSFGFIPDCGSMCQMIENAVGKSPIYIGKPNSMMIDIVREKYGINANETVVIGDRLYTDIASGNNAQTTTVCVLTGEATPADIEYGSIKPSFTLRSVKELYMALIS